MGWVSFSQLMNLNILEKKSKEHGSAISSNHPNTRDCSSGERKQQASRKYNPENGLYYPLDLKLENQPMTYLSSTCQNLQCSVFQQLQDGNWAASLLPPTSSN